MENTIKNQRNENPETILENSKNAPQKSDLVREIDSELITEHFSDEEADWIESEIGVPVMRAPDGSIQAETIHDWFRTPGLLEKLVDSARKRLVEAEALANRLQPDEISALRLDKANFFPAKLTNLLLEIQEKERMILNGDISVKNKYEALISKAESVFKKLAGGLEPVPTGVMPEKNPIKMNEWQEKISQIAALLQSKKDSYHDLLEASAKYADFRAARDSRDSWQEKKIFFMKCVFERDALMRKAPEFFIDNDEVALAS